MERIARGEAVTFIVELRRYLDHPGTHASYRFDTEAVPVDGLADDVRIVREAQRSKYRVVATLSLPASEPAAPAALDRALMRLWPFSRRALRARSTGACRPGPRRADPPLRRDRRAALGGLGALRQRRDRDAGRRAAGAGQGALLRRQQPLGRRRRQRAGGGPGRAGHPRRRQPRGHGDLRRLGAGRGRGRAHRPVGPASGRRARHDR